MNLNIRTDEGVAVIDLAGQVSGDEVEHSTLNSAIGDLLSKGKTLFVLNCDNIDFIDESGVQMLLKVLLHILHSGGDAALVQSDQRNIFDGQMPGSQDVLFSEESRAIEALKLRNEG